MSSSGLAADPESSSRGLRRLLWRWHFYAGLCCVPFILLLATTGSLYLFKPQVEHWQDRAFDTRVLAGKPLGPEAEAGLALARHPDARLEAYELPHAPGAAGRVWLRDGDGERRRVVVHPVSGATLDDSRERDRLMRIVQDLHGELLLGDTGSLFVELAACWGIVMVLTGLYLWWPRGVSGLGGVLYPRLRRGAAVFWRDLHAVTGISVAAFALFLLLTALPWTGVWGKAFRQLREVTGTAAVRQDWSLSRAADHSEHAGHAGHDTASQNAGAEPGALRLDDVVGRATALHWPPPVLVSGKGSMWTVKSETQNRPQRESLVLDSRTGEVLLHERFRDKHVIDRIVGVGVAAHEGQLFGFGNQMLGLFTALGLVTVAVSGLIGWWRRRPARRLGAPPAAAHARPGAAVTGALIALALFLPLFGASVLLVAFLDRVLLRNAHAVRTWLGLSRHASFPKEST